MTMPGFAVLLSLSVGATPTPDGPRLLLRDPAISKTNIAFVYAGDLWVADRNGQSPRRLTSSPAEESAPTFSPDGSLIAFTASWEDNRDVYVIPSAGGQPKRLTWHPEYDQVLQFSSDGKSVAFASRRETVHGRSLQLYNVDLDGGLPRRIMDARIFAGRYDSSGEKFAYFTFAPAYNGLLGGSSGWRGYRGGTTPSIRIMDLKAQTMVSVPSGRVNDIEPMWVGNQLFFISDRDDKVLNVHRFDPATSQVVKVTNEPVWDVRAADAHGTMIIYEAGGRLKTLDTATSQTTTLDIRIAPDLPQVRPQWKSAAGTIESAHLAPAGNRVLFTARGEVFSVPGKKGPTRNLSATADKREYTALWSPDGKRVAFVEDGQKGQWLVITDHLGLEEPRRMSLGPDFHFLLAWTNDGKRIVYENQRAELHAINVTWGRSAVLSKSARRGDFEVASSPDGRWLAYTENQPNFNSDLFLHDFTTGKSHKISDGFANISAPVFSLDGKYLYFAASTNAGPVQVGLDMSSRERPYRAGLYAVVLTADGKSPVAPKTADPKAGDNKGKDTKKKKPRPTKIDTEGLSTRIVALPVPKRNYDDLAVAKDGTLYFVRRRQPGQLRAASPVQEANDNVLERFNFDEYKVETVMPGITEAALSARGEHVLVHKADGAFLISKLGKKLEPKPVATGDMKLRIDPRQEWALIFDEAWRMERDYFYAPNMHGLDWKAVYDRYRPLVDHVGRREDLTALIVEMIGELQAGHNRSWGGDIYRSRAPKAGLLGADFKVVNGRHQIARIYTGEGWNPFLKAPLASVYPQLKAGDFITAVNGRALGARDNIFEHLQGMAGKQVTLRIARGRSNRNARNVTVEAINSERLVRLWWWIEQNRQAVDKATDGRVGYVYLPNTADFGFTFFNRMFFAQVDKDAVIIDERSNGGGQAANYITDVLGRFYLSGWKDRESQVFNTPGGGIYGPKVMLIDQDAGSGGDFLPYSFRSMGLGPLIGKRTWGGLIGIFANPLLIDGGAVSVPNFRFFDRNYKWSIENEGVAPDIEVELDPIATNKGRDTQLERAIQEILKLLKDKPSPVPRKAPPYPTQLGE